MSDTIPFFWVGKEKKTVSFLPNEPIQLPLFSKNGATVWIRSKSLLHSGLKEGIGKKLPDKSFQGPFPCNDYLGRQKLFSLRRLILFSTGVSKTFGKGYHGILCGRAQDGRILETLVAVTADIFSWEANIWWQSRGTKL